MKRDLSKFQCPQCGNQEYSSHGRKCKKCDYNGDWIQPNETMTYGERKIRGLETEEN